MNNLFNEKNSFQEKNNYSSNSNISNTSSNFISEVNYNLIGGSQISSAVLEAFNQGKIDIALYMIDKICDNLNCAQPDYNGNTILHYLATYCNDDRCLELLNKILSKVDSSKFIDMQNNKGETAILIATKKGNNLFADALARKGANKKIEDLAGNFVYTEDKGQESEFGFDSFNTDKNKITIIKLVKDSPKDDLSSLNLTRTYDDDSYKNSFNSSNNSFLSNINRKLKETNLNNFTDSLDSSNFLASLKKNIFNKIPSNLNNLVGNTENEIDNLAKRYSDKKDLKQSSVNDDDLDKIIEQLRGDKSGNNSYEANKYPDNQFRSITSPMNTTQKNNYGNKYSPTSDLDKNSDNLNFGSDNDSFNSDFFSSIFRKQAGGKKNQKYKVSGSRDLKKKKNYSLDSNELSVNDSDKSYKSPQNELSRLINSRKDELHKEVYNMVMELLNRGELMQNNKPIDATERNARLIKTYLYRKVSEENPQFNGMDKILAIKKMSDVDIVNAVQNLPDLDKYEKEIKESIEKKRSERQSSYTDKKNSTDKKESVDKKVKTEKSKKDKIKLSTTTESDKKTSSKKKSSTKKSKK